MTAEGLRKANRTRQLPKEVRAQRRAEILHLIQTVGVVEAAAITKLSKEYLGQLRRRAGLTPMSQTDPVRILNAAQTATGYQDLASKSGFSRGVCEQLIEAFGRRKEFKLIFRKNRQAARGAAMLQHLKDLAALLGRAPGLDDVRRVGTHGPDAYYDYFGSFPAARRAAGLPVGGRGKPLL